MIDFKSAAEQQVRETLGWWIVYKPWAFDPRPIAIFVHSEGGQRPADSTEIAAYNALVSKTAELLEKEAEFSQAVKSWKAEELLWREREHEYAIKAQQMQAGAEDLIEQLAEMTAQRDEAQKALETAKGSKSQSEAFSGMQSNYLTLKKFADNQVIARADAERRAESAEATIREQAERIKELENALSGIVRFCGIFGGECKTRVVDIHAIHNTANRALGGKQ